MSSRHALSGVDTHSYYKDLIAIVPSPLCVYYAAIPLTQYPLLSQLLPGHDAEETSPWKLPRLTNC